MFKNLFRGATVAAVMGTQVAAQELPPLDTPAYRPNCSTGELVAEFAYCSIQMVPVMTMSVNGQPAMSVLSPQPVCRFMGTNTEDSLEQVRINLLGDPRAVEQVIERARRDLRDPASGCPSLAAF